MAYKVHVPPEVESDFQNIFDYLTYRVGGTGNYQAAHNFAHELDNILKSLTVFPHSHALCEEDHLNSAGIRKAHFHRMRYKILYHIKGDTVFIDAIFNDLQDYGNLI